VHLAQKKLQQNFYFVEVLGRNKSIMRFSQPCVSRNGTGKRFIPLLPSPVVTGHKSQTQGHCCCASGAPGRRALPRRVRIRRTLALIRVLPPERLTWPVQSPKPVREDQTHGFFRWFGPLEYG